MLPTQDPSHPHYNPDPHAHPGLHVIAIVEAAKGLLAVLAASGLELLGPAPLRRFVHLLIARFQLDPDHGAMAWLAGAISPDSVHFAGADAPTRCISRVQMRRLGGPGACTCAPAP